MRASSRRPPDDTGCGELMSQAQCGSPARSMSHGRGQTAGGSAARLAAAGCQVHVVGSADGPPKLRYLASLASAQSIFLLASAYRIALAARSRENVGPRSTMNKTREDVYLILTCFMTLADYCKRCRASAACDCRAVVCSTCFSVSVSGISAFYLFWESISEEIEANNACNHVSADNSTSSEQSLRLHLLSIIRQGLLARNNSKVRNMGSGADPLRSCFLRPDYTLHICLEWIPRVAFHFDSCRAGTLSKVCSSVSAGNPPDCMPLATSR